MAKRFLVGWEERHQDQKHSYNADESEALAFLNGQASIEAGVNDERIADALDDETPTSSDLRNEGIEGWHEDDIVLDEISGRLRGHVERRSSLLGDSYPFVLESNTLVYQPSPSRIYEFCLICSNIYTIPEFKRHKNAFPSLFERVSCSLFRDYIGSSCKAEHIGWPRDDGVTRFKQIIDRMHEATGEFFWSPEPALPEDPSPKFMKDCGIDFIVWKEPPEEGLGAIFFLGQCATGRDWTEKTNDIDLEQLGSWIRPLSYVRPVSVFAMPYMITDVYMRSVCRDAGFVLDRMRASLIAAENGRAELAPADEAAYLEWTDPAAYT